MGGDALGDHRKATLLLKQVSGSVSIVELGLGQDRMQRGGI